MKKHLLLLVTIVNSIHADLISPIQNYNNNEIKSILIPRSTHQNPFGITTKKTKPSWNTIPRGGSDTETTITETTETTHPVFSLQTILQSLQTLQTYLTSGTKSDTLLLLLITTLIPSTCLSLIQTSPILGYLSTGLLLGPNGYNVIKNVHGVETLADLGIVFFLFEMGTHLDFDTLMSMKTAVFGLGLSQFLITAIIVGFISNFIGGMNTGASVVLGGALALSSSAFVLQLLKDAKEMGSEFGRNSFGVLLLQDLAVVPLLVITPLLGGKGGEGGGVGRALGEALIKAIISLTTIGLIGKYALDPVYDFVASSKSDEAFLGLNLLTILGMSFLTEGLGLSNTLGAFLAGVLLSENEQHKHRIETNIEPFRAVLVGLFFFTVGFEIDLNILLGKPALVGGIVLGLMSIKTVIVYVLCRMFGLSASISQRCGLILSQGGEFAFVAFRAARSFGVLEGDVTKLMLTCVSLTMALTPFAESLGRSLAEKMKSD